MHKRGGFRNSLVVAISCDDDHTGGCKVEAITTPHFLTRPPLSACWVSSQGGIRRESEGPLRNEAKLKGVAQAQQESKWEMLK